MKSVARQTLKKGLRAGKAVVRKQMKTAPKKILNYAIKQTKNPKTQQMIRKAIVKRTKQLFTPTNTSATAAEDNNPFLKNVTTEIAKELTTQPASRRAGKRKAAVKKPIQKRKRRRRQYNYNSDINSLIDRS